MIISEQSLIPIDSLEVGESPAACSSLTLAENSITLKHDRYFLITNPCGDVVASNQCSLGLFHDDTRILNRYSLHVRSGPPSLLAIQVLRSFSGQIDLAISDADF